MPEFRIIKQVCREAGCIPACAASVLRHHQIAGSWTEFYLLRMYDLFRGSGFEILSSFLRQHNQFSEWEIVIKKRDDIDLKRFLVQERSQGTPVLFAVSQGALNNAHCFVIAEANETHALVFDPWPERPDTCLFTYDQLLSSWAGDLLYFLKKETAQ